MDRIPTLLSLCVAATLTAALLTTSGCGDPRAAHANSAFAARSTGGPFLIGLPTKYQRAGIYTTFAKDHGVFLVSAHDMLVALADTCPNPIHGRSAGVRWDATSYIFKCPSCSWKFTSNGLPIASGSARAESPGSNAPRALERCVIRHYGPLYDPATEVQVNPVDKNRMIQEDNQWSEPAGMYAFETPGRKLKKKNQERRKPVF